MEVPRRRPRVHRRRRRRQNLLRRETGKVPVHHDDPAVRQHLIRDILQQLLLTAKAVEQQRELALQELPPPSEILLQRRLEPGAFVDVSHGEPPE